MRQILMTLAAICMASLSLGTAQAQMGAGYVDIQRVLSESPQGKASTARVEAVQQSWRSQLEVRQAEVQQLQADFQEREAVLNDATRARLQREIEMRVTALRRMEEDANRDITKVTAEELRKLEKLALPAVEAVRKEALVGVVLRMENLIAADPSLDLTDAVIAKLAESQ
ncbi:MAG: OmpH family outer membrane protein [Pseudomonadota bacterium]